ncbi:receptor protein EIX2 [Trifolium repens]|nr:receptor protein EIX2 [Trifolium repens]
MPYSNKVVFYLLDYFLLVSLVPDVQLLHLLDTFCQVVSHKYQHSLHNLMLRNSATAFQLEFFQTGCYQTDSTSKGDQFELEKKELDQRNGFLTGQENQVILTFQSLK